MAREVAFESQLLHTQSSRLASLLDADADADHRELVDQLVALIQDSESNEAQLDEARQVVMSTLAEDLAVLNPRFDTSLDIDTHA